MPADGAPDHGGALVLAAGFGRRFGSDKRLHRLPDGTPLLLATLAAYRQVFSRVAVVLRPEDDALGADVRAAFPEVRIIHAREAHLGMGHSLAAGIGAVAGQWKYACVALGDMPWISARTLSCLRDDFLAEGGRGILQPTFEGRPGHPVFFAAGLFAELGGLKGDSGARSVVAAHRDLVRRLPVEERGVIDDLDQPPG